MRQSVSYIRYATSSHEKTGNIIAFAQFEEGGLVWNECIVVEEKLILASVDELSIDFDSDNWSISTKSLNDIRDGKYVHPYINARDAQL